jgi:hypothetical protein
MFTVQDIPQIACYSTGYTKVSMFSIQDIPQIHVITAHLDRGRVPSTDNSLKSFINIFTVFTTALDASLNISGTVQSEMARCPGSDRVSRGLGDSIPGLLHGPTSAHLLLPIFRQRTDT